MNKNTMDTCLFCLHCDKETEHQIVYQNNQIQSIKCRECGMTVQINEDYVQKHSRDELVQRVLSKPRRITREIQADLNGFLKSLPHRMITKPYRVYKEWEKDEKADQ